MYLDIALVVCLGSWMSEEMVVGGEIFTIRGAGRIIVVTSPFDISCLASHIGVVVGEAHEQANAEPSCLMDHKVERAEGCLIVVTGGELHRVVRRRGAPIVEAPSAA